VEGGFRAKRRGGRHPIVLSLTAEEEGELRSRLRAHTSSQRDVLRARIVLACSEARSAKAVATDLGIDVKTVEVWRGRFRQHRLKGLRDRPRPGRPPKFGGAVGLEIIALACEPVPKKDDGTTDRTIAEVREQALSRRTVSEISWSSVQRLLAGADIRPHHVEGWLHSIDPEFREKATRICDLYLHPPPDSVVVCVDEMPGVQALRQKYPDHWGVRKGTRQRRREFEYVRGGTQALIAGFDVKSGEVIAHCGDDRSAASLEHFMEDVAAKYPTGTVYIVWDNLNIHYDGKPDRWTRFNERHGHRFIFVYTPRHASWVNQIEIFFSIVQRKCLRHGSFASKEHLRSTLLDFIGHWNKNLAHPFRWTFTGYPLRSGIAA
jgi:transposase